MGGVAFCTCSQSKYRSSQGRGWWRRFRIESIWGQSGPCRFTRVKKEMSSILQSVGWRNHSILENLDELDSPKPDKFKKMPSSSSLNTLRMTLRKRMPLKEVKININNMPNWDTMPAMKKQRSLTSVTVSARSVFGAMSQKITKTKQNKTQYLLASPEQVKASKRLNRTPGSGKKGSTPKKCNTPKNCGTPRRSHYRLKEDASPSVRFTPKSSKISPHSSRRAGSAQWKSFSNFVGKDKLPLRRSSRAAALRSPYSSPVAVGKRRQFDKDLEAISTGIRQLKRLSRVFDDAILKEESDMSLLLIDN
ncbi:hypothetical protein XENTR_v10005347 [Xenopus tropicalis]|uniref:Protein PIMREG isoform X2 n=2 Tax=Xenopus tropicalis TaxID=8364 RepID=A0A8J0SY89_XENTR|nr:protein PIMREG isoform X2 [Xenopus tropicalis]KAE8622719.1 hypothetical protein XENTR_v10005347 [Xenopus tropicalis]KAE8622720.1 hypothetical protein XENTR_v10005347 [Xenopus tropicalis]|eukprot:XP_017946616.1 PREDICTED: protein FAM64A isoform X2 [Xenopus tropicalis]